MSTPSLDAVFFTLAAAAVIGGLLRIGYLWGRERKRRRGAMRWIFRWWTRWQERRWMRSRWKF